jgi:hypothetical protein
MSDPVTTSVLTCPQCGFTKQETMPDGRLPVLLRVHELQGPDAPKPGECCVFCSYGTVACPPIQAAKPCCSGPAT